MGTSLTGKNISTTYLGLLKTTDNAVIGSTAKRLTDGSGTDSPLYLSTSKLGIGVTPTEALTISSGNIQLSNDNKIQFGTSDVYISGTTSTDNIQLGIQGATKLTLHQTTGLTLAQYGSGSITGTVTQRLGVTSAGQVVEIPIGGGAVDGSGTAGKITKWTDSDTIGNSIMTETTGLISVAGDVSSKTSDGAILNLQTSDTTVTTDSVLGSIQFNAPNEASGGDAILKSAEIEAVALSAFSATNNATKLVFKVGDSEVASEVLSISKALNMASFATPVVINSSSSSAFKIASGTTNDFLNVGHSAGSTYLSRIGDAYGTHTFKQWDGTTTRNILTLDASQNATFAGDVRINGWIKGGDDKNTLFSTLSTGVLLQTSGNTAANDDSKIKFRNSVGGVSHTFDANNGNATFAGNVLLNGYLSVEGTTGNTGGATDRWIGGDGTAGTWFYNVPTGSSHLFGINNSNVLTLNGTGATFAGDVTIGSTGAGSDKILNILTGGSDSTIKLMEAGTIYGFSQVYSGANNQFYIKRHSNSATGSAVITLNRDNDNATFAGTGSFGGSVSIGVSSPISGFNLDVQGGDFRVGDDANQGFEAGYSSGSGNVFIQGYNRGTSAFVDMIINNSLTVLAGGNSTFAGNVTLNGDGKLLKFTPTSYDNVELGIDSNGFVIYNTTDARYDLKINGTGNATFGGSVRSGTFFTAENAGSAYIRFKHGTGGLNYIGSSESIVPAFGDENDMVAYTSGKFGVYTGATLALTLDESQNATFAGDVIIGSTTGISASTKLAVSDTNGAGLEVIPQTSDDRVTLLSYDRNASTYQTLDTDSSDVHFNINGSEKMRLDSSGNTLIGIDTISATLGSFAQLEVSDSTKGGIIINTQTADASNYSRLMFTINNNINGHEGLIRYNTSDYHMAFFTDGSEKMRLNATGLGIGTTSPEEKLMVAGAITSTSSNSTGSTSGTNRAIMDLTSGGVRMGHFRGTTTAGSGYLGLYTDSLERMRITSGGILDINPNNSSTGGIVNSYRAGVSVSTTATVVGRATDYGGLAMVWVNSAGNIAHDLVSYSYSQVDVLASQNISGSPVARTYSASTGGGLKVAMASGTYDVYVSDITVT